jgi:hypothetical protein
MRSTMSFAALEPAHSPRETRIFALILLLVGAVLGFLTSTKPLGLLVPAGLLTLGWLGSLLFNEDHRQPTQGTLLPGLLLTLVLAAALGLPPRLLGFGLTVAFGTLAAGAFSSFPFGAAVRDGWMRSLQPMGWTVSRVVLGAIYFLVLTPIGLLMRLLRRDPLELKRRPEVTSFWRPYRPATELKRYFRQF